MPHFDSICMKLVHTLHTECLLVSDGKWTSFVCRRMLKVVHDTQDLQGYFSTSLLGSKDSSTLAIEMSSIDADNRRQP